MTELKHVEGELTGSRYKSGVSFKYTISIPQVDVAEFALLVEHDGPNNGNIRSMLALADEGKAPYCISIGVMPGVLTMADGSTRDMRMNCYDVFDREYADFLVYELLPSILDDYGLKISSSPDMHMISGGSSGGLSAFRVAWFHPEYFHRVHMSSPSFLAMGRGNELPYLIRKCETKPLRISQEMSETEPNDYFGWSRGIDEEADKGLSFAGYDIRTAYFAGEGHCSRYGDYEAAYCRNEWLWQDWATTPIVAHANSPRVDKVVPFGTGWEKCDTFPYKNMPTLPATLAVCDCASASCDGLAYYAGNKNEDAVYLHAADANGSVKPALLHAALHTVPRIEPKGAIALATDACERLYVLTAIGIQCVRSYGLIDVILDLPDGSVPADIAITDALYVKTEEGVYKRPLCANCTDFQNPCRKYVCYFD